MPPDMVTAYPVSGKRKSVDVCVAFIAGCGGHIVMGAEKLREGPALFYGVDDSNQHLWEQVLLEHREFWYIDNAYFDETRQKYFRVTKNATQHAGTGESSQERFGSLGIAIKPWREGEHILVCPQSESFMRVIARHHGNWMADVLHQLQPVTDRRIVVRGWQSNKATIANTLDADLDGAYCVIAWSSAAAVSALLRGIPVIVQGESPARHMGGEILDLESLPRPSNRREWAGVLADNQWTLAEMSAGSTWSALH